jgi:hypothetical protein
MTQNGPRDLISGQCSYRPGHMWRIGQDVGKKKNMFWGGYLVILLVALSLSFVGIHGQPDSLGKLL